MRNALILCIIFTAIFSPARLLSTAHADDAAPLGVTNNKLIKFTDSGIVPPSLQMKRDDGLVFFLNNTSKSYLTIEIDYAEHHKHCATTNLELSDDGIARSKRPIPPQDFALVCFPDSGNYELKVAGLPGKFKNSTVKILVE